MKPDTTDIRAFAAGLRTSVGIRDELLSAQSHLLTLCDALDSERAANAEMRRALEAIVGRRPALAHDAVVMARAALRAAEKAPETTEPAPPVDDPSECVLCGHAITEPDQMCTRDTTPCVPAQQREHD